MNAQVFLKLLFDAIALSFISIVTLDFIEGLMQLWQISTISPEQQYLSDEKVDLKFDLESEPGTERFFPPVEPEVVQESQTVPPSLEEILQDLDIEHLQLRPARKIAKALGIAQKVNGRDQPLSFLRAQIKTKLQQPQELPSEALLAVRDEFAS